MTLTPAIVCLTAEGAILGRRLVSALPGSELHGLTARVAGTELDRGFTETLAHLRELFENGRPIIGICAAGILIRALASLLDDKRREPPVLAVAQDGSAVVPLLGGHRGANELARRVAALLDISPAITTAGDVALGLALDEPPPGWRIGSPARLKTVAAALLAGEPIGFDSAIGPVEWLAGLRVALDANGARIRVDYRESDDAALVYHPPVLALGVGTERDAPAQELIDLVAATLAQHHLSPQSVALVASIDLKLDEPAVHQLAAHLGVQARFLSAARLAEEAPRLANPSIIVEAATGTPGVAEAAALAAAGPDSILLVPKIKARQSTCAIALAAKPISPESVGRKRGALAIVGIGPGQASHRTADAVAALAKAESVVGYQLYLDLIADLIAGKPSFATGLGNEIDRVRQALDRAAAGSRVALVSSGDAGIYALASLAFEEIDRSDPNSDWRRLPIDVHPGLTAMQLAASRCGAMLGHDFCAISLSDLLTPWSVIEARLAAAAKGDFVVSLYNPRSERRAWQLARAIEILGQHRLETTPVIVARDLARPGERIILTTLGGFDPEPVDMLTLVVVGSSASRAMMAGRRPWVYTPRGYQVKRI